MLTDIDILEDSIRSLGSISVPIEYMQAIAEPISRVRRNLMFLTEAIKQKSAEKEKQASEQSEVETEASEPESEEQN